jgi:hypothetical protein
MRACDFIYHFEERKVEGKGRGNFFKEKLEQRRFDQHKVVTVL